MSDEQPYASDCATGFGRTDLRAPFGQHVLGRLQTCRHHRSGMFQPDLVSSFAGNGDDLWADVRERCSLPIPELLLDDEARAAEERGERVRTEEAERAVAHFGTIPCRAGEGADAPHDALCIRR